MFFSVAAVNAQTPVFEENFSTWNGWSDFSAGSVEHSSEQSRSEGFSLKKIQNNDPNGGWKALGATIGREFSFEGWIYRPDTHSGGGQDRISITNADFDGYGFRITGSEIRIEVRENGNPVEDIASANWNRTNDEWYRFVFVSNADNTFTLSIFNEASAIQASITSPVHTNYNIFDRVVIHGGHHFYVDDLSLTTASDPVFMAKDAGPAGVGNRSGDSNQPQLVMWLDASAMNLTDGDDLGLWYDVSGSGNNATQITSDNMPVWQDNQLNGLPVVRFRPTVGGTERAETWLNFDGSILANTPYSVFSVASRRDVIDTWDAGDPNPNEDGFIMAGGTNSNNQNLIWGWRETHEAGSFSLDQYGNGMNPQVTRDNVFHIISATRNNQNDPFRRGLYYEGSEVTTSGMNNTTLLSSYNSAAIGRRLNGATIESSKIDLAEHILFSDFLNPAQRIIVDNYLAFKYGLSLVDKQYHFTSATYIHDFVGIGHSAGSKHIENTAKSGGGLYIAENAASLDETDEYIFAAHNGTTHAFSTANYADPDITQRWARDFYVYRIQNGMEGAGSTSIRIGFDFEEAGLAITPDKYYYLMYRSGISGNYEAIPGALAAAPVDGETIWFTLGDSQFQSGYYTIAETHLEPVEVIARGGPAGIGNADGSNGQPQLVMWLDATRMELNHTDKISIMTDFSGNSNHAEQPIPDNQPTFLTSGTGGFPYPVVSFDPANDEFLPFNGNIIVNTSYTFSFVGARRSNSSRRIMVGGTESSDDQNLHIYFNNDNTFHSHQYGNDHNGNMINGSGGTNAHSFGIFTALLESEAATAHRRIYQNNQLLDNYSDNSQLSAYPGAAFARYINSPQYNDVEFSEAIFYADALNDAQNIILNNHLHYKYGIEINNKLFTNVGAYIHDVIGIGLTDANNIHRETTGMGGGIYLGEANNSLIQSNQFVFASHSDAPLSLATSEVPAGIEERLLRDYYIQRIQGGTVNAGTTDIRIGFDFEEINQTAEDNLYYLLYRSGTSGDYQVLPGASGVPAGGKVWFTVENDNFSSGYYTIGRSDESPVIWYTYQSGGDWSDWETWSLNSSSTDYSNPQNQIPSETDRVVILPSITVRADINDIRVQEVDVRGTLNLENSTGHNFGVIKGQGRIRLNADQLAIGDLSQFVSATGGTVEYYGATSFALNSAGTYNHLEVNMSNGQVLTMMDDLSLNGDLIITNGTFRINDDATEQILNLLIKGNFEVSTHGSVSVGLADTRDGYKIQNPNRNVPDLGQFHSIFHQITLEGDLTNNGSIRLTNLNGPLYDEFADNGAATFIFAGPRNPQRAELYGTTDFYNLIVNKGNDKTYITEIYSENRDFFALYGSNSVGRRTGGSFTGENPEVRKALWIRNGTLKLEGSIWIPSLTEGSDAGGNGDYPIGSHGKLWIAGGDVMVYTTISAAAQAMPNSAGINTGSGNQALSLYGTFRISNGFFGTRNSAGFIFWADASASVIIEGGIVDAAQYRSSNTAGGGKTFHYQTGGEMIIRGSRTYNNGFTEESGGEPTASYPLFGITETEGVFQMSGGTITMISRLNNDDFHISAQDYSVTGGKLHIKVNGNETFVINSTSPVWDLEIERLNTNNTVQTRFIRELTVLNDLVLHDNTHLHARENNDAASPLFDLNVGRHFELGANASYTAWNGVNTGNITRFTGSENAELRLLNSADNNVFNVFNLEINKTTQDAEVVLVSPGRADATLADTESPVNILNSLRVLSGVFDYDRFSLRSVSISGDVVIENCGTIGRIGSVGYLSVQVPEILVPFGSTPVFGRLLVDRGGSSVSFTGGADFTVGDLHMREGIIDIGTRSMTVYNEIHDDISAGEPFGPGKYIRMDGNHGDGGLIRRIWQNGDYFYPIGTQDRYAYADPAFSNVTDEGYVQINAVPDKLPTLGIVTGGNSDKYLNYYWRVRHSGFDGNLPDIANRFLTNRDDYNWDWENPNYLAGKVVDLNRYPQESEADDAYGELQGSVSNTRLLNYWSYILEEGEYTSAFKAFFQGSIRVFYSKLNSTNWNGANWNNANNWSFVPHGEAVRPSIPNQNPQTNYPSAGDIAVISSNPGGGPGDGIHVYTSPDNLELAELRFIQESGKWSSRLRVERNHVLNIGIVSGEGTIAPIVRPGEYPVINADLSEFVNGERSVFNFSLTSDGDYEIPSYTTIYPNLRFEAENANIRNRTAYFTHDVIIQRNLRVDWGSRFEVRTNAVVRGNLNLGDGNSSGRVQFSETEAQILEVGGITMTNRSANIITVTGSNSLDHRLIVNGGNILQNHGTIDLFTNNTGGNNVVLEIRGGNDSGFDIVNGNLPSLYRMVIDKEHPQNRVAMNTNFTLNSPHDQAIPALELTQGTLILNHPDIDITLSSNEDYTLTDGATLQIDQGQIRLTHAANLILRGGLELNGSSTAHFHSGNSSILYSSTGNALLSVADAATLHVGGQIRSGNNDNTKGVLRYRQTGGAVHAGSVAPSHEDYGVLEVFNPGSEFTFTGGELHILNSKGGTSRADLYLETSSAHVNPAGTVFIGSGDASGQTITLDTQGTPLPSLYVQGTNNKAQLRTSGLHLMGDLNVGANNSFDANDAAEASVFHNVRIEGDLINRGTVAIHTDTLFMQGTSQNILGNLELNHWVVDAETGISLDAGTTSSVIVNGNIHVERGTLTTHNNDIIAHGHVHNYGAFVGEDTENGGLFLTGTTDQNLFGDGIFARLEINKPSGQAILNGHLGMDNNLVLTNGNLHMGNYRLTLSESSRITGGDYGPGRMITTTGAESARGLVKHIGSGAGNFIFPLGVGSKYTPVEIVYSTNNNPGTLTVRPRNEKHITTVPLGGDVLQWHWLVNSHNLSNFSGTLTFEYDPVDVVGNIDEYLAARLLDDADATWAKFPGQVDKDNHTFFIEFNGVNDVMGDYTAGIDPHIPDNVPLYVSTGNGDWTLSSNWVREDDMITPAPAGGPLGVRVRIEPGHTITIPGDQRVSYRTIINGRLDLGATMRHNLGRISGSGTLALSTGVLPGGDLNPFFQTEGSTLEYYGAENIAHPATYDHLQNLTLKGNVRVAMPSTKTVFINDALDIQDFSLITGNRDIRLRNRLRISENGKYEMSRLTIFDGDEGFIEGNFDVTGKKLLYLLVMTNGGRLSINGRVHVSGQIGLRRGVVEISDGGYLFIEKANGLDNVTNEDWSVSWVNGSLIRTLDHNATAGGNTNLFPVGNAHMRRFVRLDKPEHGSNTMPWTVHYKNQSPGAHSLDPDLFDENNLHVIHDAEFWEITPPEGVMNAQTHISLGYGMETNIDDGLPAFENDISIVQWKAGQWEHAANPSLNYPVDFSLKTVTTNQKAIFSGSKSGTEYFTFGARSENTPLPIELLSFTAQPREEYVELEWVTASETNNDFFTIERSRDGEDIEVVAVIASQAENGHSIHNLSYTAPDTQPMEGLSYYRLKQTDFDGSYEYSDWVEVLYRKMADVVFNLYPNPNPGNAFHMALNGLQAYETLDVNITSLQGRRVYSNRLSANEAGSLNSYIVPSGRMTAGVYLVTVTGASGRFVVRMVVN